MYTRLLFEYSLTRFSFSQRAFVNPLDRITYLSPFLPKHRNPFRPILLRRPLHSFRAVAPVTLLGGVTYLQNRPKTCKSFTALLLPHLFPVSPLLHYSYKKMGGRGLACRLGRVSEGQLGSRSLSRSGNSATATAAFTPAAISRCVVKNASGCASNSRCVSA